MYVIELLTRNDQWYGVYQPPAQVQQQMDALQESFQSSISQVSRDMTSQVSMVMGSLSSVTATVSQLTTSLTRDLGQVSSARVNTGPVCSYVVLQTVRHPQSSRLACGVICRYWFTLLQ